VLGGQVDLEPEVPVPGGVEDQVRGGDVLSRDADGLVQRDLSRRRAAGLGAQEELADFGVDVSGPISPSCMGVLGSLLAPAGGGASTASRDSTTTTASMTVAESTSGRPCCIRPT
jgi:hypothetical protein